ncbi:DUF434 domain-containing protein [Aureivirga sp. CE67]|uniref:DUF434 domain-containing protein n=1 Tax=Aureivirga sp. CE67 TaxID=1788983 RepID=UPI0018CB20DE|nr:DUF434 domain-containing protein [Aureivirga sp. CE67]
MPNTQKHRGANPKDAKLFAENNLPKLKKALIDLSYLVGRDYSPKASLKLIGDRYRFSDRQRQALSHSACGENQLKNRIKKHISKENLKGQNIVIDGYNQLITLEAALSKAPIFIGIDGCCRDIASVHSTYRKVEETITALELFGQELKDLGLKKILWVFDKPVSNSGNLKQFIEEISEKNGWNWEVILEYNPDKYVAEKEDWVAVSTDSWVLERAEKWFNLNGYIIEKHIENPWIVDFREN